MPSHQCATPRVTGNRHEYRYSLEHARQNYNNVKASQAFCKEFGAQAPTSSKSAYYAAELHACSDNMLQQVKSSMKKIYKTIERFCNDQLAKIV